MDKELVLCIIGAIAIISIAAAMVYLAAQNIKNPVQPMFKDFPTLLESWRQCRTNGERFLLLKCLWGQFSRKQTIYIVCVGFLGICLTSLVAVCSPNTLPILEKWREILDDLIRGVRGRREHG